MNPSLRIAIGVGFLLVGLGMGILAFTTGNVVIWYSVLSVLSLVVGFVLVGNPNRPRAGASHAGGSQIDTNTAQRKVLLFLLRRCPAALNVATLEAAACAAWERGFGKNRDGSKFVESGDPGLGFVVQAHGNAFMVLQTKKGTRNLKSPQRAIPESAMSIWTEYTHELSVGVVYNYDTDANRLYAFVGNLCAALVDDDTLAVVHVDSGQLWQLDRDVVERLQAAPEAFFGVLVDR
jgi:hypothetical protein